MDGPGKKKPSVTDPKPRIRSVWLKAGKQRSPASDSQAAKGPISESHDRQSSLCTPTSLLPDSQTDQKPVGSSLPSVRSVWIAKKAPEESTGADHLTASGESLPAETKSIDDDLLARVGSGLVECVGSAEEPSELRNGVGVGRSGRKKKSKLPVFSVPEHLRREIEMDKVPEVLGEPLSPTNYSDYFSVLLYAEDFYIEKWSNFLLYKVTLEMDSKEAKKEMKNKINANISTQNKVYILFEITLIPERRPYLLSRDYVFLRRSGKKKSRRFEGRLVRVIKSTYVLAEFGDDLYSQHSPSHKYDVSFSFNRICLKRSHLAVRAALDPSFQSVLFPSCLPRTTTTLIPEPSATFSRRDFDQDELSVIHNILSLRGGAPPYVICGRPILTRKHALTNVGTTILEAILQIYAQIASCRILVCAPKNRICDKLISSLNETIPDSELFRANAAFREIEDVPVDVFPLCSYDGECFSEPPLPDRKSFKIIASTFMTCFRLLSSGIGAGHFTHVFVVDASSATEPEAMVALANFARDETVVVVTGSLGKLPETVRSDVARRNGLRRSYFHRLVDSEPYSSNDPSCVCHLR